MKKIVSLLLVIVMAFSFYACDETKDESTKGENTVEEGDKKETNAGEATEKVTEAETEALETEAPETEGNKITFTEMVAFDNDECSVKITGIEDDSVMGFVIKAQLENKSAETNYTFSVENASINGVQCNSFFSADVAAGKKSIEKIIFNDEFFNGMDIGDYTDIELLFNVYDSDDVFSDDIIEETVRIYPYGEDKAVKFTREPKESDTVVLDNEYVTVIVTGYEMDESWGYSANLFLVNKTDKNIVFDAENVSVNGFMLDSFFSSYLAAGKCSCDSMTWLTESLEEIEITSVENIEFKLNVYDADDWSIGQYVEEDVKLNP